MTDIVRLYAIREQNWVLKYLRGTLPLDVVVLVDIFSGARLVGE